MGRLAWPALLTMATLASLALAACDEAGEPPFLPETVTPELSAATASSSPAAGIGSYDDPNDFRSFGQRLAAAIEGGDVQFFLDNSTFEDLSCVNEFTAPAACSEFLDPRCDKEDSAFDAAFVPECPIYEPPDASVRGIVVGVLQSEGFGLDAAGYEGFIREFLTTFEAGASDAYGRPEPRLYAYAVFGPEFAPLESENVLAVATRIVPATADRSSPPGRSLFIFRTAFDGQAWRIIGLLTGGDPISLAWFLDPTGETATQAAPDGLFTFWRRWEG